MYKNRLPELEFAFRAPLNDSLPNPQDIAFVWFFFVWFLPTLDSA